MEQLNLDFFINSKTNEIQSVTVNDYCGKTHHTSDIRKPFVKSDNGVYFVISKSTLCDKDSKIDYLGISEESVKHGFLKKISKVIECETTYDRISDYTYILPTTNPLDVSK